MHFLKSEWAWLVKACKFPLKWLDFFSFWSRWLVYVAHIGLRTVQRVLPSCFEFCEGRASAVSVITRWLGHQLTSSSAWNMLCIWLWAEWLIYKCISEPGHRWFKWCLGAFSALSRYITSGKYWFIINWNLRNKFQWNLKQNTTVFWQRRKEIKDVFKMAAMLSLPQCVSL